MLYEPMRFDALIDEPWVPARIEDAIAAIVADADTAFDATALWPTHEWDAREKPLPLSGLYVGAAEDGPVGDAGSGGGGLRAGAAAGELASGA